MWIYMERSDGGKRGRPKKYNEPVVRKTFDFPASFVEKLDELSESRRQSLTDIIIVSLENEVNGTPSSHKVAKATISKSAIKEAVLAALDERESAHTGQNTHQVELSPELSQKLSAVSESAGFVDPGDFIEEVLRVMLRDPAQLREMVIGKTIRDLEAVIGSLSESETPQKKSRKVA